MEPAIETVEPLSPPAAMGRSAGPPAAARLRTVFHRVRFAFLAYAGSRVLLMGVAVVNGHLRHRSVLDELANWDGFWYRAVANLGAAGHDGFFRYGQHLFHGGFYPHHVFHAQTNLGFFPLYPLVMWVFSHPVQWLSGHSTIWSITVAGVAISTVGGFVTTVIVQELTRGWWGAAAARRSVLLFCLFPGSVIFSMVYAEGIVLPLAAGCILALQRRRWVLAGVLAGLATAGEPEAVVLILVCAVTSARCLRMTGPRSRAALRSLLAPLLSTTGLIAVCAFMWAWTGDPLATFTTQHYGWHERADPLALVHLVTRLADQVSFSHFNHPTINLNLPIGILGAAILLIGLVWLIRSPRQISLEAWVWTLGISFLMVISEYVPPNPRLLITAFPVVLVYAYRLHGRRFNWLLALNLVLLAGLSALTFHNVTLRP